MIKMTNSDNIKELAKKSGINEIEIRNAGLNPEDNIGNSRSNISTSYRKAKDGKKTSSIPPTEEQVKRLKELGISLKKIDITQEFIEKIEKLKEIGVDVTKMAQSDNIKELAKKSGIEEIEIRNAGLNPGDNIGNSKNTISMSYRKAKDGKKTNRIPPTEEQVKRLKELGISLEERDVIQEFIDKIEKLKGIGVDMTKMHAMDNIKELAKKSGIDKIEIKNAGLNPEDNIGRSRNTISISYRKAKDGKKTKSIPPTDEQVQRLKKLGISLEKIDITQEFIEKIEKLKGIGVDVIKMTNSDNIKELAKKSGINEIEIRNAGLNPEDNIGNSKNTISTSYRKVKDGKKTNSIPPTEEQVERLKELGISLESKRKSSKELAEATISAIKDPELLDKEQQALDAIVSQTKEKGGKNGKEQS